LPFARPEQQNRQALNTKYHTMKKKNTDFESEFWDGHRKHSALGLMDTFFHFHDPATAKNRLYEMMEYTQKPEVLLKDNPSVLFNFYLSLQSFVRAGYGLQLKTKKWTVMTAEEPVPQRMPGSLSENEYRSPVSVFRKAFKKFTIRDFDVFLLRSSIFHSAISIMSPKRISSARSSI
jgi:hypothetical protein